MMLPAVPYSGAAFDWSFPHASRRVPLMARCMVSTSQPLAAQAGLQAMERGGNAVDAALAAAITLVVVEPVMNGLGSDTLALVWDGEAIRGLNGSGRAPAAWTPGRFAGAAAMPGTGWDSVTVPGAVSAWVALSKRHGRLPFEALFADAVRYAEEGFLVTPTIARQWALQSARLREQPGFAAAFLPDGRPPRVGERFAFPDQARSLRLIAESEGAAFYCGELAERMVAHSLAHGGVMSMDDLACHRADEVVPMAGTYRGLTVHELPPNAQGLAVLIALGILEQLDVAATRPGSVERVHLQVEAMKLAFADVQAHVADAAFMRVDPQALIDPRRLLRLARGIDRGRAAPQGAMRLPTAATVYVAAADRDGNVVSLIQSNYRGFGSGVVVPGTGISLHNRGACFSADPAHPNAVGGGKRPLHTILPAMLSRGGMPLAALGVVGANMQPQGQLQIVSHLEDDGLNPQAALDAPRWRIQDDGVLTLEAAWGEGMARALAERGHRVRVCEPDDLEFGGAQLVHAVAGGYVGASDPRRDGWACGR